MLERRLYDPSLFYVSFCVCLTCCILFRVVAFSLRHEVKKKENDAAAEYSISFFLFFCHCCARPTTFLLLRLFFLR